MANKPINRFVVQYTWPTGSLRWSSPGKTKPFTPAEIITHLREIADEIERIERLHASEVLNAR